MYRIYKELTDECGNVVHKVPVARTNSLKNAVTHAKVWGNGWQMGIYEIKADAEVKVYTI